MTENRRKWLVGCGIGCVVLIFEASYSPLSNPVEVGIGHQ